MNRTCRLIYLKTTIYASLHGLVQYLHWPMSRRSSEWLASQLDEVELSNIESWAQNCDVVYEKNKILASDPTTISIEWTGFKKEMYINGRLCKWVDMCWMIWWVFMSNHLRDCEAESASCQWMPFAIRLPERD